MGWTVLVESDTPNGARSAGIDRRVAALSRILAQEHGGEASGDVVHWSAKVVILEKPPVLTAEHAAEAGRRLVVGAAEMVGLPVTSVRCAAVVPDLLGSREVATRLGVSRQRFAELRSSGRLPVPVAEPSSGPVWLSRAIDDFAARWVRQPGPRPGKTARFIASDGAVHSLTATADERVGTVWVPVWLAATQPALRWIIDELRLSTSPQGSAADAAIFRVPRWEWAARIDEDGASVSDRKVEG
jgi:hypothetical protein